MNAYQRWLADQSQARKEAGLTRHLVPADTGPVLLDLAGNDYLGLARDPRVTRAAADAAVAFGAGAGASRLVSGSLSIHAHLEADLARLCGAETALVLSTGYAANLSVVTALADAETLIVSDSHVHASLVDACRLARGTVLVVPHHDVSAVSAALAERTQPRALVLVESIYSVLGDAAPLADLAALCERYDALLVVDEAHGLGVVGDGGRGLAWSLGLGGSPRVVLTGTLSKSLGSQGGVVLGSPAVREHLVNRARPFIYDTGLAPAAVAGASAALRVLAEEPQRVQRVQAVAGALAEACGVEKPAGAVVSVPMPGPREALAAVARAAEAGLRIGCFRPPSVPDGHSRLRLTAHAHLTEAEVDGACMVLSGLL